MYDPFCGTGTTPIEAALQNRIGLGSDVSRTALQVAVGKKAILDDPAGVVAATRVTEDALLWTPLIHSADSGREGEGSSEELNSWYEPHTLDQLRGVWKYAIEPSHPSVRPALEVLFTDTLFACASTGGSLTNTGGTRRHHWGWVADNVRPKLPRRRDAVELFLSKVYRLRQVADALRTERPGPTTIFRADARQLAVERESVDLVVTSPPYLGMIDYTRASRLTYYWYGWPMLDDERREIGARFRRTRADAYDVYVREMDLSAQVVARCLRPGGYCAVLVGASRKFPAAREATLKAFANVLDTVWGPVPRRPTRRRVAERAGRNIEETLCVYQCPE